MKKRILAITLALCMALTLFAGLPLSASAANFTVNWPAAGAWTQGTAPDWANNATVEVQQATLQAIYDEYDYQASIGFDMGTMNGGLTAWGAMVNVQFENGDHTGNPWNQAGRRMGGIVAPFAGVAFSVKAEFGEHYGFIPLGNQTTWTNPGDTTYKIQMANNSEQVFKLNKETGEYEYQGAWGWHAGQDATNKEAFQKAYAYAAAGKTTGERVNLGYAPTGVQKAADGAIEWQEFRGDENTGSYGMFTAGGIAIIAMKVGSDEAYLIEGDMLTAWKSTWSAEPQNDLTTVDMFAVTGAPVGNAITVDGATYQAFENGTYVAKDGALTGPFEDDVDFAIDYEYVSLEVEGDTYYYTVADDTDVSKLDLGIVAVGAKSTTSIDLSGEYDYSAPVTFTVTAESGRTATYTIVVLSNQSAPVEDRLAALKVQQMIDNLPATIYRNDLIDVAAIKDAYAALTPAQKSLVDMSKVNALNDRIVELGKSDKIRVACVGDSITDGIGALNGNETYPAKMSRLLGASYQVVNYGISGYHVMTDRGATAEWDPRYYYSDKYQQSKELQPNIVIFALGTNDAGNGGMWDATAPAQFEKDYKMMINEYLALESNPIVLLSLPMACWDKNAEDPADWTHNSRHNNNVNGTIPIIKKIYEELKAAGEPVMLLDMQTFTINNPEWFGDGLHPNDNGYTIISAEYAKYVLEATDIVGDISVDSIELDGEAMAEFDEATKNYKVEVEDLNDLPTVEAKYTESTNKTVTVAQATAENPTATVTATSSVGSMGTVYSITFYEGVENDPAVAEVVKLIENIDDATITLADDEAAVELAQRSYNALSAAQKAEISDELTKKLNDAVAAIKALNDQNAADAVTALIDKIGTVDLNSEAAITAARDAYDALTDDQKALVDTKKLTDAEAAFAALTPVREAIALIEKLPAAANVEISNQADIEDAQAAYDALTDDEKAMVSDELVKKLEDAAAALKAIQDAYTKYEAEEAALAGGASILTDGAEDVSGGKYINNIGGETGGGGTATFTVSVPEAGEYQLDIYYITWGTRTLDLTVNGTAINLSCPGNNSSWNGGVLMVSTPVTLNAGNNTIVLGNNTGWAPNIDFIALPVAPADDGGNEGGDDEQDPPVVTPDPDKEAADKVIKQIDDLGEITALTQEAAVVAARAAFDALTDAQEKLVTNKDKLIAAEAAIQALKDAQNPPATEKLMGDVDFSGTVDVADIMKAKDLIMSEGWDDDQLAVGDLSGNGAIDVADIMAMKNIIMAAK